MRIDRRLERRGASQLEPFALGGGKQAIGAIVGENPRIPVRIGRTVGEARAHLLDVGPDIAPPRDGMVGRVRNRFRGLALVKDRVHDRSEEHTSELQSLMRISYAVFCLKKQTHLLTAAI